MDSARELEDLAWRLDGLAAALISGSPATIEQQAGLIVPQLEQLRGITPSNNLWPALSELRAKTANLRALLVHAEQVRWGVAAILGMLYQGHAGAQYSALGAPQLPHVPRIRAEA